MLRVVLISVYLRDPAGRSILQDLSFHFGFGLLYFWWIALRFDSFVPYKWTLGVKKRVGRKGWVGRGVDWWVDERSGYIVESLELQVLVAVTGSISFAL